MSKIAQLFIASIYFLILGTGLSCSPSTPREEAQEVQPLSLSYAQGFKISQGEGFKILEVLQAYPGEHEPFRYLVVEEEGKEPGLGNFDAVITLPVEEIVLTSTTQVPHLDFLGIPDKMIGFPNTDLISSSVMRTRIDAGKVKDLGRGPVANVEMIVDLNPDLVIFSTLGENIEPYGIVRKAGIPFILNGEYTEQDPLGRAEWIKFTGALTGKYPEAVAVFEKIEGEYLALKEQVAAISQQQQPTVISGIMYKDIWYAPAAD